MTGVPTQTGATTTLSLVWAARATTSAAGNLPVFAVLQVSGMNLKAPEAGVALLLGSAAAWLVLTGRRRRGGR